MGKWRELSFTSHRVQIRVEGFRLERLLDQSLKKGLELKQVRMVSSTEMTCWISAREVKTFRRLAKSTYRITTMGQQGPVPALQNLFHQI